MKMLCLGGLVVLSLALGYTIGLRQRLDSPFIAMRSATITPDTLTILQDAQRRAHEAGDAKTEAWLRQCAEEGRTTFFNWAKAKAHGQKDAAASGPERHAASR
jgi:hypothetical protein